MAGVDEDRERSPLHEQRDSVFDVDSNNREMFRTRVRKSGSSGLVPAKGPLNGRHPFKVTPGSGHRVGGQVAKYGGAGAQSPGPGSNETSPLSPRKMSSSSTCGQEHKNSPPVFRKPSHPAPQRPSKLPVMPMYNNNQVSKQSSMEQTMSRPLRPSHYQGRKLTPPCSSDQESVSMSPVSSMTKHNRIMYPMSAKRAASPSRTTSKRQGQMSPKRNDISRRVSSPVYTSVARRRSPSLTRSRPPSPGGVGSRPPSPRGPNRRNPSPSQLDPEQADALRRRLGKARKVKLYLLQQSGSNSFLVAGDSPGQKYKVNIGPQTCSCGKGPGCLHLLFIMLRVFKIQENDSRLTARELKEFEIEALFRSFEERKKSRVLRSRQQSMENLNNHDGCATGLKDDLDEEDANCAICQDKMSDTAEKLTTCCNCHNSLHHHCMTIWMEIPGENVFCPLCRAPWQAYSKPVSEEPVPVRSSTNCYQYYAPSPYQAPSVKPRMSFSNLQNTQQNFSNISSATSSGYSTISRTSDTIHMIEQGGSPEDIPLPKAEPIPQQHWSIAQHWITHYGRDLVGCLLSRDWVNREIGLRRLAREVVQILKNGNMTGDYNERTERAWKCCAEMLATMIEDKVYKVYLAAVRATRALLNFLSCRDELQLGQIRSQMRPIIQSVLVKCADGNRRISELSTETLVHLCRGQEGEYRLGKHGVCTVPQGLGGVDFIVPIVLEERDLQSVSWQWIMGRLVLLDRIIKEIPDDFSLDHKNAHSNFTRLMKIIDFTFLNLGSSHVNVCKLARRVFILAARNTACDNQTFNQVWELLGSLDPTLQMRMRKKLTAAIEEFYLGESQSCSMSTNSSIDDKPCTPQEQDRRAFLEEFLRDCSNKHTGPTQPVFLNSVSVHKKNVWRPPLMRSTSHSPSRQIAISRSSSQSPSRVVNKQQLKKPLSVLNINQQSLAKKPSYYPANNNKPRNNINRLKTKYKIQDSVQDILPTYDLSFLSDSKHEPLASQNDSCFQSSFTEQRDDSKRNNLQKSPSLSRVQSSRHSSPTKQTQKLVTQEHVRSPPAQKKWTPSSPSPSCRTPVTSPLMGRDKRSVSCKEDFEYKESLALAMALSKSIYLENPLPVIPGLSCHAPNQDILAHPHRDMIEDGQYEREYAEGIDWTKGTVLGTGAYSTCYQARDVETGTLMAAKQISFCRNSDEEQDKVESLIREEVLLISKLQHPHIVRMYGAIQEGSHINVFVEWMAGGSIASLLDKHGVFTESVIVRYLHQILLGLEYLHSNGILHRDLKGANLLVDTSGHHLRIADFGAAARMMSKSTVPGEFQGQLQGTIAFMAPEVLRGDSYGRSCDIWSLGCSIIEMATGKPPWGASDVSNHLALIFRIACASGPPEVPVTLSPALRDLALRCLELDPNNRPSARDLLLHPVFHEFQ